MWFGRRDRRPGSPSPLSRRSGDIDRRGREKSTSLMPWPAHFAADRRPRCSVGELVVGGAGPQRAPQVGLVDGEEAGPELAVGGEAHPVARRAERVGDRRDHADLALAVDVAPPLGRLVAPDHGLERPPGADGADDLGGRHDLVGLPAAVGVERHELDVADLDAPVAAEGGELDDLVVVDAPHHDGVELHRREAGVEGGVDALEHPVERRRGG